MGCGSSLNISAKNRKPKLTPIISKVEVQINPSLTQSPTLPKLEDRPSRSKTPRKVFLLNEDIGQSYKFEPKIIGKIYNFR